jgi:hypothetical protein
VVVGEIVIGFGGGAPLYDYSSFILLKAIFKPMEGKILLVNSALSSLLIVRTGS